MKNQKSFNFTLALFISVGVITGCSQNSVTTPMPSSIMSSAPANQNVSSSTPASNAPVVTNPSNQSSTTVTSPASTSPSVTPASPSTTVSTSSTSDAKEAMASYYDDESTFKDSESLSNDGFATKALLSETKISTDTTINATTKQEIRAENRAKIRSDLKNSGAVTVNSDGTLTVDPVKLAAEKGKIKVKLQQTFKIVKENISQLRRKNNIVRKSDTQEIDNGDGTKTKTVNVDFKNEKLNISRDNVFSKTTSSDGKVIGNEHSLNVTNPNYTRVATRVMTLDTTTMIKKIIIDSTTTWKNGRKVIVHEERIIDSTGKGTGTGTMIVTTKEGKTITYNLSSNISVSAQVAVTATDPITSSTVTTTENVDGTATQMVTESGKTDTTTVNLETTGASATTV